MTPATTTSSLLQNLPNFASLFGFDYRLKALEDNFSKLRQTNQYAKALSSIPGTVDQYLANKMQEQVTLYTRKYDRIRENLTSANHNNSDSIDRRNKKIMQGYKSIKREVSKKFIPKVEKFPEKDLNDKMEANNLSQSDISRQLYKALVEALDADQILLDTYGDTVTNKRPRDGAMMSETLTKTTSTDLRTHKKSASQSVLAVEEAMANYKKSLKAPATRYETGVQDEQAEEEFQALPDYNLAQQDPRESFDELTDSTFDFSAFVLNRLNVQTLTPELLAGPTFELMKGTCKSLTELEYFCEEVYKATTEKLDWINPEGRQYPHDLRQPLPLVPNSQGRRVIPFHHFINNDLEYLRGGVSSRKYSTSVTKTTAADYGHIKWIEDLVPNSMWSQTIVKYDKFALWGISHWGKKRRQFYAFATSRESARDVYSKRRIIAVTKVEIVEWHDYKHLDWITIRRDDDVPYKFKEGDFYRLRIQDIEDMLLLLVQGKVTNLSVEERIAFNVSLRMFTRRVVIQRRVEDLQLGVESYQKKLNLTKPDTYRSQSEKTNRLYIHTPIQEDHL
ncbi:hypothetical protein Tco_1546257 [Tanacetum coccineum]